MKPHLPDADFEHWYRVRGYTIHDEWHPEEGRYTLLSFKQICWDVWKAAKKSTIERCAKTCESFKGPHRASVVNEELSDCADAIRALGETT
jgi:hypothetical protein